MKYINLFYHYLKYNIMCYLFDIFIELIMRFLNQECGTIYENGKYTKTGKMPGVAGLAP